MNIGRGKNGSVRVEMKDMVVAIGGTEMIIGIETGTGIGIGAIKDWMDMKICIVVS